MSHTVWEYTTQSGDSDKYEMPDHYLAKMGHEGWEAWQIVEYSNQWKIYFKRQTGYNA